MQGAATENYGDLVSPYLAGKISGRPVQWVQPSKLKWWERKRHYLAIGSILPNATKHSIVWGSGIITRTDTIKIKKALAVRGPLSRKRLIDLDYPCPEVYGDPALLLPLYYHPSIDKKHDLGWIPHYVDYKQVTDLSTNPYPVINLRTNDIETTTTEILACKRVLSSSLHGLIVAHAYGIPAIWIKISDKLFGDDVKFADYFESVRIQPYEGSRLQPDAPIDREVNRIFEELRTDQQLPHPEIIKGLREGLLDNCPFRL